MFHARTARLVIVLAFSLTVLCHGAVPNERALRMEAVFIKGATFVMGTPLPKSDPQYHANEAPLEGVEDMLGYLIGEWCVNKYVGVPSPDQANDPDADLENPMARRVVRGCYHRSYRLGRSLLGGEGDYSTHLGRPWTRIGHAQSRRLNRAPCMASALSRR